MSTAAGAPQLGRPIFAYVVGRAIVAPLTLVAVLAPVGLEVLWSRPLDALVLGLCILGALVSVAVPALRGASSRVPIETVLLGQLLVDLALITCLLDLQAANERATSPVFLLYFIVLIVAGQLLDWGGRGVIAGVAVAGYLWSISEGSSALEAIFLPAVQLRVFALLLVALLVSLLIEQVRSSAAREIERSELRAEAIETREALLMDELGTGVLLVSSEGRIDGANPAAQRILGEVAGLDWTQIFELSDRLRWEQSFSRDGGSVRLFCSRSVLASGGHVVLVDDVTRLRDMEDRVQRAERMAAVGRLAAGLAHEIRNPLASLSGSTQMLAEDNDSPLLGIMQREVDRLNRLVEDFLESSRPVELEPEDTDLGHLCGEVAEAFALDPRYSGRVTLGLAIEPVGRLVLDQGRVRQVIWNLLLNAAQHVPEDGTVALRVFEEEDVVKVEVEDDGVGIPHALRGRIFDPFFTTRVGGTGLGLATVERVMSSHGGRIEVDSSEGEGTCIRLTFPRVPLQIMEDT